MKSNRNLSTICNIGVKQSWEEQDLGDRLYRYFFVRFRESTARRGAKDKMDKGRRQKGARTTPFTTYEVQFQSTHDPSLSGDKQKLMHFWRITANTPWCHSSFFLSHFLISVSLCPPLCRFFLRSLHIIFLFFLFWLMVNWSNSEFKKLTSHWSIKNTPAYSKQILISFI